MGKCCRAQTLVFEQVLLFLISVAIFIVCFGYFQVYQNHYTYLSAYDQLRGVSSTIEGHVIQLTKFHPLDGSVQVQIPQRVGGELYFMEFSGTDLNVSTSDNRYYVVSNVYELASLGKYSFSGKTASSSGKIIIYKRGTNIILG